MTVKIEKKKKRDDGIRDSYLTYPTSYPESQFPLNSGREVSDTPTRDARVTNASRIDRPLIPRLLVLDQKDRGF